MRYLACQFFVANWNKPDHDIAMAKSNLIIVSEIVLPLILDITQYMHYP